MIIEATEVELPRAAIAVSQARTLVREFACDLAPMRRADAMLAVSELVTNAYLYGQGPIRLRLEPSGPGLRVSVQDEGNGTHRAARSGLRLGIVGILSDRWGVEEAGATAWCEIGTAPVRA